MENGHDTTASPRGEGKIGRVLERARQERGLSLEEAERATKIRKRYLIGLEQDDYTVLPDAVYARGFLKTYANFLGLDGGRLSDQIRSRREPRRERGTDHQAPRSDFEKPVITPGGVGGTRGRKFPTAAVANIAVAVLILAAVIGTLYYVGRGVQTEAGDPPPAARGERALSQEARETAANDGPQPSTPEDDTPSSRRDGAGGAGGGEPVANEAPLDVLTVGLEVKGAPSWILVEADSEVVSEEIAQPGFSRTFEADRRISINTGNAGAVTVVVNGQDVGPLGADGEVLTRNFTLKNAS